MDMSKLGLECSEMMEALGNEFPDDAQVGVVGLVVEMLLPDNTTHVATFCSDDRRWVQIGFFHEAAYVSGHIGVNDGD